MCEVSAENHVVAKEVRKVMEEKVVVPVRTRRGGGTSLPTNRLVSPQPAPAEPRAAESRRLKEGDYGNPSRSGEGCSSPLQKRMDN